MSEFCPRCGGDVNTGGMCTKCGYGSQYQWTTPGTPIAQSPMFNPLGVNVGSPGHRAYKCPRCGGEFDRWEGICGPDAIMTCPFCGLERGKYEPPKPLEPGWLLDLLFNGPPEPHIPQYLNEEHEKIRKKLFESMMKNDGTISEDDPNYVHLDARMVHCINKNCPCRFEGHCENLLIEVDEHGFCTMGKKEEEKPAEERSP